MKRIIFLLFIVYNLNANVGKVTSYVGEVSIIRDNIEKDVKKNMVLLLNDTIKTKDNSKALILMNDNTSINVGKKSSVSINEFIYDDKLTKNSRAKFSFGNGLFRTITGKIGKLNPNGFRIKTKTASIGIRGTVFDVVVKDNITKVGVIEGGIYFVNDKTNQQFEVKVGQKLIDNSKETNIIEGPVEESKELESQEQNSFKPKNEVAEEEEVTEEEVVDSEETQEDVIEEENTKEETQEDVIEDENTNEEVQEDVIEDENTNKEVQEDIIESENTNEETQEELVQVQNNSQEEIDVEETQEELEEEIKIVIEEEVIKITEKQEEEIKKIDIEIEKETISFNVENEIEIVTEASEIISEESIEEEKEEIINNTPTISIESDVTTSKNESIQIDFTTNDDDNDELTIVTTQPEDGTLEIENSIVKYTPNEDFYGTDTFTITVTDSKGDSSDEVVTITVYQNPIDTIPSVSDDTIDSLTKEIIKEDTYNYVSFGYLTNNLNERTDVFVTGSLTPTELIESYIIQESTASYSGDVASIITDLNNVKTNAQGTINLNFDFSNKSFDGNLNINDTWNANINSGTINSNSFTSDDVTNATEGITGDINGNFYGPNADNVGGNINLNSDTLGSVKATFGGTKDVISQTSN